MKTRTNVARAKFGGEREEGSSDVLMRDLMRGESDGSSIISSSWIPFPTHPSAGELATTTSTSSWSS